jgi:hypothetical protein
MLKRILGTTAFLGILFVVPVTLDQPAAGPVPTVTLNDASCTEEEAKCCIQLRSICMDGDEPVINHRGAAGSSCAPH